MQASRLISFIATVGGIFTIVGFLTGKFSIHEFTPGPDREPGGASRPELALPPSQSELAAPRKPSPPSAEGHAAAPETAAPSRLVRLEDEVSARIEELRRQGSAWPTEPALHRILRGRPVRVYFTEDRLEDAAEIAHRLFESGAEVDLSAVLPGQASGKEMQLSYHWNRLQAAKAAQHIVNDIEPLRLIRNDALPYMAVWVVRGSQE